MGYPYSSSRHLPCMTQHINTLKISYIQFFTLKFSLWMQNHSSFRICHQLINLEEELNLILRRKCLLYELFHILMTNIQQYHLLRSMLFLRVGINFTCVLDQRFIRSTTWLLDEFHFRIFSTVITCILIFL